MPSSILIESDTDFYSELRKIIQEEISKTNGEPSLDEPMSIDQTAKLFGVTVQTIYSWLKKDELPSQIIGGRRYFFLSDIKKYLANKNLSNNG